jgi:hypothetical protein
LNKSGLRRKERLEKRKRAEGKKEAKENVRGGKKQVKKEKKGLRRKGRLKFDGNVQGFHLSDGKDQGSSSTEISKDNTHLLKK